MKSGIYTLTFLVLFATTQVYSQTPMISQLKLPQFAPVSPDAAALGKFGNFPTTYSTGVPNISIPLWTIQAGSLRWPIALSYHASGIKVDESASMAGLGWSLQGPAVISRTINGLPDEEPGGAEPTSYSNVTDNDFNYLYRVKNGSADAELDLFNFSFNGKSGKFVLIHDANATVLQIPQSNFKISHDANLNYFIIMDDMGNVYTFDQKEQTTIYGQSGSVTNTTSWYLSKVELPDKNNTLNFSYSFAGNTSDIYKSYTHTIGRKNVPNPEGGQPTMQPIFEDIMTNSSGVNVSMLKLTTITFPNGSLSFNYDPVARQDIGGNNVNNKLTSIVINEIVNGQSRQVKTFRFNQSYFHFTPVGFADAVTHYRLRLDNLVETGTISGPNIKQYTFQYNSTSLPPRGSTGQDIWGLSNGVTSNATLLQTENVTYYDGNTTISATIGNANRSVNATYMKSWMLTSITYPTGGKTEFEYEPHVYATDFTLSTPKQFEASIIGNQAQPLQDIESFTFPSTGVVPGTSRLIVDMSKFDFTGVTNPSVVVLRNVTLGQDVYVMSQPRPYERYLIDVPITLKPGDQYELKATLYTSQSISQLDAAIRVRWSESTTAPDIRTGGGLRVKQMLHYADNSTVSKKETFIYDTAITMTPFHHINQRYKDFIIRLGIPAGLGCAYHYSNICRVYHSQSVYAISNALGSPMLYSRVEKIDVNPTTGTPNGKSEYIYDVFQDATIPVGGPLALGAQWNNGFLTSEKHYKYNAGTYEIVKKIENGYGFYNSNSTLSLRVEPKLIAEGCSFTQSASTVFEDLRYYTVHIPTGSKRLAKQTITEVDEFQNNLVKTTTNYYSSLGYDYPRAVVVEDSKKNRDSVTYKYSPDFALSNNVYDKMEQQNILQPVIEQVSYTNTTKLATLRNHYRDWFGNSRVIALDTVQASTYTNPLETQLRYYSYDAYNNPLSMSRDKDVTTSYLWGYNNSKPIAQVTNANSSSVAYTSFETSETGGWSGIAGSGLTNFGSLTGLRAWTKNGFNFSKASLSTTTSYIVSYWSKNGSYSVNGVTATAGRVVNGWTLYSHTVTPATGTITLTGSGSIDELRLYPATLSQMTTWTYEPLGGVSSICDANNRITFYEYDELQRPVLIRDQDRNISKKFSYNYNGVFEYPNIHYNSAQGVKRYKQGCTGCQIGSSVTYTVPDNTFLSTESVAQANGLASAEAGAQAQAYANVVGTCITPTAATVPARNEITNNGFSVQFHNNCTNINYTYSLGLNANIAALSPAPPFGNYNVTISKMNGPGTYTYRINGDVTTTSNNASFTNIEVTATGNAGVRISVL